MIFIYILNNFDFMFFVDLEKLGISNGITCRDDLYEMKLLEELSVSPEVSSMTEKLYNDLLPIFKEKRDRRNPMMYGNIFSRSYNIDIDYSNDKIFGLVNKITYLIYDMKSYDEVDAYYHKMFFRSGYDNDDKNNIFIYATVLSYNGEIDKQYFVRIISHELMHAFQDSKILYFQTSNLYQKATNISLFTKNENIRNLGYLIYLLDKREIDANMQSIYNEMKTKNLETYKESSVYKMKKEHINICHNIYKSMPNDEIQEALNIFGISLSKLNHIIEIGIEYFNYRVGKVYTFFLMNKNNKIKEELDRMKQLMNYNYFR